MNNTSEHIVQDYTGYVRPWLGELLQALSLDIHYTRAFDNQLFHQTSDKEISVLDFLGGYGANLFGHYHPRLKARMQNLIEAGVPLQAQGSIRYYPAKLAQKLSQINKRITGHEAIVTLTNSGAETVEAAIKHACLARRESVQQFLNQFHRTAAQLSMYAPTLPEPWLEALRKMGYQGSDQSREALAYIESYNHKILTQNPVLLALKGGFHGKTTGAVQLTHNPLFRYPMEPFGIPTRFIPTDIVALEAEVYAGREELLKLTLNQGQPELNLMPWNHVLGCFLEPLQGEGGIKPTPSDFLLRCRELADTEDFVLILDEIQCGMGRTGSFYYSEQLGVAGDYYLLAKSLGGGLSKIGALIIRKDKYCTRFGEIHSSTFAEDELSAGLALESILLLEEENLMHRASVLGNYLLKGLKDLQNKYPKIMVDVRGTGLMLGVEFADLARSPSPALQMLSKQNLLGYILTGYLLHEHGIRVAPTLSAPRCLRLEPAVTITEQNCNLLLQALEKLCEVLQKANIFHLTRFLIGRSDGDEAITNFNHPLDWDAYDSETPQVAFAGHFIQAHHMQLWDRGFGLFTDKELNNYMQRVYLHLEPEIYDRRTIYSITGQKVQLNFIGICVSSQQMYHHLRSDLAPMQKQMDQALETAATAKCQVLGLGGYTSIVTTNGQSLQPDLMAITTGNALTVGMGWRAIRLAAEKQGIDLAQSCFAAIGATGNIASVYSELMAEDVPELILIGRPGSEARLMKVAKQIYQQAWKRIQSALAGGQSETLKGVAKVIFSHPAYRFFQDSPELTSEQMAELHLALQKSEARPPIRLETDMLHLHEAQLILGASNTPEPLIHPDLISSSAPVVICDISIPQDTDPEVLQLAQVQVIQGGVVQIEKSPNFHIGGIPLETGLSFACMAETILMGLEGIQTHYSYGRINRKQVKDMLTIADKHGFSLGRARIEDSY